MKTIALVCCLFLAVSCAVKPNSQRFPASIMQSPKIVEALTMTQDFQALAEEHFTWRAETAMKFEDIVKNSEKGVLSPADRLFLTEGVKKYTGLREKMFKFIQQSIQYTESEIEMQVSLNKKTYISKADEKFIINPNDVDGLAALINFKVSMAAALILYDNFQIAAIPFYENKQLAFIMNTDIPGAEGGFHDVARSFYDRSQQKKMERALKFFDELAKVQSKRSKELIFEEEEYLNILVNQSFSRKLISERNWLDRLYAKLGILRGRIKTDSKDFRNSLMNTVSQVFGNTVGLYEERKGYVKGFSQAQKAEIVAQMKPLDIVMEKTPFRLTDHFIPGHYGHAAIFVGTKSQLQELGAWEELEEMVRRGELKKEFLNQISNNQANLVKAPVIIEALRPGVEINSFEAFSNIDDFAVLRRKELPRNKAIEYLKLAFKQLGKAYDFNFDVNTEEKIVCSELIYRVFIDDDWEVSKAVGRWTISPDQVASQADEPGDLYEPVYLINDGKVIKGELMGEVFALLLQEKYEQVKKLNPWKKP